MGRAERRPARTSPARRPRRIGVSLALCCLPVPLSAADTGAKPSTPATAAAQTESESSAPRFVAPGSATLPALPAGWIEVWVDLTLPGWATGPSQDPANRALRKRQIVEQQDEVMGQLRALGVVEIGRVQGLRNALAVRLPAAQAQAVEQIPGVKRISLVRHIQRDPLDRGM